MANLLNSKKISIVLSSTAFTGFLLFSMNLWAQTQVLASIRPLALLTQDLILDEDSVDQLLSATASPHYYALKISDFRKIIDADLVLWIGPELESFLQKALADHPKVLTLSELSTLRWAATSQKDLHHAHSDDSHQHELVRDPHLWLNPINLKALAEAITENLIESSPEREQAYKARLNTVLERLTDVDRDLTEKLATVKKKSFIVLHPAYSHFVTHYELNQLDYVVRIPEATLGARHRYKLQQFAEVDCIFGEKGYEHKRLNQLAEQLNARVTILDPLGVNIADGEGIDMLLRNLGEDFHSCLSKQ